MSAEKKFKAVEVDNMHVMRVAVSSPYFKQMFGIDTLPLTDSWIEFDVKHVRAAYANGIRRVMIDELPWLALNFDSLIGADCSAVGGAATAAEAPRTAASDPMMFDQVVRKQITQIALRPQLEESLIAGVRFGLDVYNNTSETMSVFSGDLHVTKGKLKSPIFNPTFYIAKIQPGYALKIDDIYISRGIGRENAMYNSGALGTAVPLDVPRYPKSDTHSADGAHRDESGFKVSTLVASPRHFRIRAKIAATVDEPNVVRSVVVDACLNVKGRLNRAIMFLERQISNEASESSSSSGLPVNGAPVTGAPVVAVTDSISYQEVRQTSGEVQAVMHMAGESDTIGNIVKTALYEVHPEILFNDYTCITHEHRVSWTVRIAGGDNASEYMLRGLRRAFTMFDQIQQAVSACKLEKKAWSPDMLISH
jgi:DNA-directed RNA polymerase subunit L